MNLTLEACPLCSGCLMESFVVPITPASYPAGNWEDWSAESELGKGLICYARNHEWESDR